jgi:PAS domain S-box-containing protein
MSTEDIPDIWNYETSSKLHQTILQASMDGFLLADSEGRLLEANDAYCRMSGYSMQELLVMRFIDLMPFETTCRTTERIEKIIVQGSDRFKCQHRRKDGSLFDVEVSGQYHLAEGGRLVIFLQDITEHKQNFQQMENLAQRLQLAVSSANLGVWDRTLHDNKMVWNDRMFELYGITREAFTGSVDSWLNGLHPEDKEAVVSASQAALNGEKKYDTVFRVCHPDGTVKHIKASGLVIRGTDGKAERVIGVNSDITETKRAEEEKAKLEGQLLYQNRLAAMGDMINNIAHQWRQPLNVIGLILQNLQLSFESGEVTKDVLNREIDEAMQVIQNMSNTINDFSNFFKQDKQKHEFIIAKAVTQTVELITPSLQKNHIEIELLLDENIIVSGFKNEYMQALFNIVANAKDVLLERQIKEPRITIRAFSENNLSVVTVHDNGGGIVDSILPKIFEPYFSTKGPGYGTGVGLYMSKVIIDKNMGGRLTVSNIQGGAEFRIEV